MTAAFLRRLALAALAGAVPCALAFAGTADDDDAAALQLADETPDVVAQASGLRGFAEIGAGQARLRADGRRHDEYRASFDIHYETELAPRWRAVFSDRLDISQPAQHGHEHAINTVREAWVGYRASDRAMVDIGRINVRHGVALGYNPTDWFRAGALRSIVTIDPVSLRENRQGSVMLRGQRVWDGGSLVALVSPRLAHRSDERGFALDWAATNGSNRVLLAVSQKLGRALDPQFLLLHQEGRPVQFGLNLSGLVNDATVAYVEWAGGRKAAHAREALDGTGPRDWRNRLAAGLTWTSANRLSLTAEYQYDGAAPGRGEWRALRAAPLPVYGAYRAWALREQEQVTRRAIFLHARWQDAFVHRLDLGAMLNADRIDGSRRLWLEARYRGPRADYVLQWQRSTGSPLATYGALPESFRWQAALRLYF